MTKKLTFCAMLSVLGTLCLLLANLLQTNTIFLYLFSTLFCYIATEEHGIRYGFLTYAVVTLLGFLLVANKWSMVAYAVIIGYYPILKHVIEHKLYSPLLRWIVKLAVVAALATISYGFLRQFLTISFSLPLLFVIGIVVFVIYDIVLGMGISFYVIRLRKWKK